MKAILSILLPLIAVLSACQPIVAPEGMVAAGGTAAEASEPAESTGAAPTVAVNFYTSHAGHERFGKIDLESVVGTDIGKYDNSEVTILRTEWFADNGALYEDAFYTMLNKRLPEGSTPEDAEAHLARVDMATGEVELLGAVIPLNLVAMEVNPCGEVFSTGFTFSNQLGEMYGDTNLYRVDRETGALDLIGDTGIEQIMDMSFAPDGTLWATVGNVLYTLDLETGTPTRMATITGTEDDLEIMGIAFTSEGDLYGTTPFADGFYKIDTISGEVTEVGRHGLAFPHGGDIPMAFQDVNCESS